MEQPLTPSWKRLAALAVLDTFITLNLTDSSSFTGFFTMGILTQQNAILDLGNSQR